MKTCQFRTIPNGPLCGQATTGAYCWFHQGLMGDVDPGPSTAANNTDTVGTSHTFATTNTTPQHAVAQTRVIRAKQERQHFVWWKCILAALLLAGAIFLVIKLWPLFVLLGCLFLFIWFRYLFGGRNVNVNQNRNTNENVNQVSPTITVSPTISPTINIGRDYD